MTPTPATRHVAYGYDDGLGYDSTDPKAPGWVDAYTDEADNR